MKILFVQDSLGTGGAERSNADLWYYLRTQGVAFEIVVLEHRKEGVEQEILAAGFKVHFLAKGGFVKNSRQIAAIIQAYGPTIVHSTLIRANLRVRLAKLFTPFYHVESLVNCTYDPIRLQDPRVSKAGFYLAKYLDYFSKSKGVDHSIAITRAVQEHYQNQFDIPSNKLSVIYRGRQENKHLDSRELYRIKLQAESGVAPENLVLITVGRQEFQKGHLHFLQALLKLYKEKPAVWKRLSVLFCGRKGNATADLDAFLATHPYLQENIHWLGHRHDVPELLAAADVFVFPSLYEGLGGSLIEAQAAALPIVCSDIPVLHEVVKPGENALLFPVSDAGALAQQLLRLLENKEERTRMRTRSLENFNQTFRLDTINEQMLNFYRKVGA